jgi:hypothetical protein
VACICRQGSAAADDTASLCSRVDSVQQHPHQEEQMLRVQNARYTNAWNSTVHLRISTPDHSSAFLMLFYISNTCIREAYGKIKEQFTNQILG